MENQKRVIALGFFDGIHIGHAALMRRTVARAGEMGAIPTVMSFDVHPDTLVFGTDVPLLNTPADRAWLMRENYGIEQIFTLHFDAETMRQPWQDFVLQTVLGRYHAAHVVCGHDFRFGDHGAGDPQKLAALCRAQGVGCDCIPEIRVDGQTVSSTRIRALLARGDMAQAVRLLGHPHILSGTVVSGRRLGRTIGIPTINLTVPPHVMTPSHGVYAARACLPDGRELMGVTNVGTRPTVHNGSDVTVETFLLDFDGDLYGQTVRLEFHSRLRDEIRFDSLDALKAQISADAETVRRLLSPADGAK